MKSQTYLFFGVQNVFPDCFKYFPKVDHAREDSVNEFLNEKPVIF